jgi:pimeloyl-ACP methyl ester carboxylesterase
MAGRLGGMRLERRTLGRLPSAGIGTGDPVLVIAGLTPNTGVDSERLTQASIGSLLALKDRRRLVVVNRRPELPRGMTMAEMAAEHADAIRALGAPVDVVGTSTGGSIAQQLAADHPDLVRRLVLLSTACRLGPEGRQLQRRVAARIRKGVHRKAIALMASDLVPPGPGRLPVGVVASVVGPLVLRDRQALDDMATTIEAEDTFDLASCATPIAAPTLLVAGRDDRFYAPELFEETARLIPGCDLRVLDGKGHITALADARCRDAVESWL